ncbi:unnamed protein product [Polarella glacialis]|uniref:Uncharacterized protein n=1 Tax=Polarella glacialis TaxID=89957 RepID=A0A813E5H3_POLGL|nr:unnamed protein product [Polarella glacialis]
MYPSKPSGFVKKIKIKKHWNHVHSVQLQQCGGFTWANAEQMHRGTCLTQHHQQQQQQKQQKQGNNPRRREHPLPKQWPVTSGLSNERDNYHVSFKAIWLRLKIKFKNTGVMFTAFNYSNVGVLPGLTRNKCIGGPASHNTTSNNNNNRNNRNKATTLGVVSILH